MTAPQASHTSKELEREIRNLTRQRVPGYRGVWQHLSDNTIDSLSALIQQRESILLKKISALYGRSLPELAKNLAHYKLEDK